MNYKVQFSKKGEKIGTYWTNINKEVKPRDYIQQIKIPGSDPSKYRRKNSKKMAKIGWKAHKDPQTAGIHPNEEEREEILQKVLEGIKEEDKLDGPEKETLGKPIEEHLIEIALKECANGSTSRINGIPYEYWKFLHRTKQENKKNPKYKNNQVINHCLQ